MTYFFTILAITLLVLLLLWYICKSLLHDYFRIETYKNWDLPSMENASTISNVVVCMVCTPDYDEVGGYSIAMAVQWCKLHSYKLFVCRHNVEPQLYVTFSKMKMAKMILEQYPDTQWVLVLDADSVIKLPKYSLSHVLQRTTDFTVAMCGDCIPIVGSLFYYPGTTAMQNAGFIVFNATDAHRRQQAIKVVDHWIDGAKTNCQWTHTSGQRNQHSCIVYFLNCVQKTLGWLRCLTNGWVYVTPKSSHSCTPVRQESAVAKSCVNTG